MAFQRSGVPHRPAIVATGPRRRTGWGHTTEPASSHPGDAVRTRLGPFLADAIATGVLIASTATVLTLLWRL